MKRLALAAAILAFPAAAQAQTDMPPLYEYREGERPVWISPENPTGAAGQGGPGESRRQGPRL